MALEMEFNYYRHHQKDLVALYDGRYIVIAGERVIGDYDTLPDAVFATERTRPRGTFLVQKCSPGDKDYTIRMNSPYIIYGNGGVHV